jgi:hypothetical protein
MRQKIHTLRGKQPLTTAAIIQSVKATVPVA